MKRPSRSLQELLDRTGINRRELGALATAGARATIDGHRHKVRWTVEGVEEPTPLFTSMERFEAVPMLRKPTEGQNIVADYKSLGLTLERHPIELIRRYLDDFAYLRSADLKSIPTGR